MHGSDSSTSTWMALALSNSTRVGLEKATSSLYHTRNSKGRQDAMSTRLRGSWPTALTITLGKTNQSIAAQASRPSFHNPFLPLPPPPSHSSQIQPAPRRGLHFLALSRCYTQPLAEDAPPPAHGHTHESMRLEPTKIYPAPRAERRSRTNRVVSASGRRAPHQGIPDDPLASLLPQSERMGKRRRLFGAARPRGPSSADAV